MRRARRSVLLLAGAGSSDTPPHESGTGGAVGRVP